jgi:hypothetical protein
MLPQIFLKIFNFNQFKLILKELETLIGLNILTVITIWYREYPIDSMHLG